MPIPIIMVISWKGNASDIGENILNATNEVLGKIGSDCHAEVHKRSSNKFIALSYFQPLDYDLEDSGNTLRWGLGSAAPKVTVKIRDPELIVYVPDTPFYSCGFYVWQGSGTIVASPWWLIPAIAAVLNEGLVINYMYLWGVAAWGYPLDCRTIHMSVWRPPLNSTLRVSPTGYTILNKSNYTDISEANPVELANLLVEGAKKFLEALTEKGLHELQVALSGGLDSRTVLASLIKASEDIHIKIKAFTIQYPRTDPKEVEIAKAVAEKFGIEHYVIDKRRPDPTEDFRNILNPLKPTSLIVANGTGGDKTLAPLGHIKWRGARNVQEMAIKLVNNYDYSTAVPPLRDLIGKSKEIMIKKLQDEAKTPLELYRKYLVEYRLMNWLTSFNHPFVTPFLYPPFFRKAFKINPRCRDYFILYAKVLSKLDHRLLQVPYYNLGCRLSTTPFLQKTKSVIYFTWSGIKKYLRGQRGSMVPTEDAWNHIELLYREFTKICSHKPNNTAYYILDKAIKWILEVRPRNAKALAVAYNVIRLLKEFVTLNIAAKSNN